MADGSAIGVSAASSTTKTRDLIAADLFCGAGGTSTGAQRAATSLGQTLRLVAVNHWSVAIATHTAMHPEAAHWCADLESVRPREAVPGGVLDLLMASPTCTFHSRARGGRPVNDQQRMDPWHVHRWCTELRVKRLLIENVPEFQDWGPCSLVTGRPIPGRKGEYFRSWLAALRAIGFRLDYRVLNCADYGDATTRQRFFLIGRTDGKALRWPEPTHSRGGSRDLLGARAPWRSAAQIIDWEHAGKSIFTRKKPLKPNTIRRLLAGAIRYFWPQPYIDALQALLDGKTPKLEFTAAEVAAFKIGAESFLAHFRGTSDAHLAGSARDIDGPVPALTAGGGHLALVMATASGGAARDLNEPIPTVVGGGNGARPHYASPLLMGVASGALANPVSSPVPTITTGGASSTKRRGCARPQLVEPLIAPYYGGGSGLTAQSAMLPLPAVTTKARFGVADAIVLRSNVGEGRSRDMRSSSEPLATITCSESLAVGSPILMRAGHGDSDGRDPASRLLDPAAPMPTLTGSNEVSFATPFVMPITHSGERRSHDIEQPLPTITCAHRGELSLVRPCAQVERAETYRIDILYRMLSVRELARAMSFEIDGAEYPFSGTNTDITKQIGNAVPVRTAEALVRALVAA